MNQIKKRLEIIKLCIDLDDVKTIEFQIKWIEEFDTEDDIKSILELLEKFNYSKALEKIEQYLQKSTNAAHI